MLGQEQVGQVGQTTPEITMAPNRQLALGDVFFYGARVTQASFEHDGHC